MRISRSVWMLSAAAALAACGSDFGGDLDGDASTARDGARTDIGADNARQADGPGIDGGGGMADAAPAPDSPAPDTSVVPDGSMPLPDVSNDTNRASDAGDARSDAAGETGSLVDARVDVTVDVRIADITSRDADGGSVQPDATVGPRCGNGVRETGEQCDDGNREDFDTCSSLCVDRTECLCCEEENGVLPACNQMQGDAEEGPRVGVAKGQLCQELSACVLKSRCGFESGILKDCYCGEGNYPPGAAGTKCNSTPVGPCIAEVEAGLEVEGATWQERAGIVDERLTDEAFGGGFAMRNFVYDTVACPNHCVTIPPVKYDGYCPHRTIDSDAGDGGSSTDSNIDSRSDGPFVPDVSAPPDVSSPPDVVTSDNGGVAPDGRLLTVDKDCNDCLVIAGQDPNACETLTGTAAGGSAAGTAKSVLCRETLDCIHQTNCHSNAVLDCYCGTAIDLGTCNQTTTQATGACKAQLDRSLEVPAGSAGSVANDRITDTAYAGGTAGIIATYEDTRFLWQTSCKDVCIPYTPTE